MKYRPVFLVSIIVLMMLNPVLSQDSKPDWRKLHYLSEEEMNTPLDPSRSFYVTDPPTGAIRNVAEFDQMQAVLVRYPFGIPLELVREMAEDDTVLTIVANASAQQTVINQYTANNVNLDHCTFLIAPTNSYWTRDYGPWFVFDGDNKPGIVNFPYNRPRPNDDDIPIRVSEYLDIDLYGMNLLHTGGNYMCDGMGQAASTDLVWEENTTLTPAEIDTLVWDYLNISSFHIRPDPLGEYIKHIDCWGKYLSPGKVLIGQVDTWDNRYEDFEAAAAFFANSTSSWGKPYEVFRVYTPGTAPNTPYTNSLILNKKVYVPLTGSQWDDQALAVYEAAMPGYEVVGVMYNGWENTDALHCRTKGIADINMLYISHIPTLGSQPYLEDYTITADITAASGEAIYPDSVLIYYQVNDGGFVTAPMSLQAGNTWSGSINGLTLGDAVDYYLYAADESGRSAMHPFIGEPDPHEFSVSNFMVDEIYFDPDTVLFTDVMQMDEGIPLYIINNRSTTTTLQSITEQGLEFGWFVDVMPDLPYVLNAHDTLELNIRCQPGVFFAGYFVPDTLFVTTNLDTYNALIMADSDLISSVLVGETSASIKTFPNPFKSSVNFEINYAQTADYSIRIYDVSGKLVKEITGQHGGGQETISWNTLDEHGVSVKTGYYFYTISVGEMTKSGKLIYMD